MRSFNPLLALGTLLTGMSIAAADWPGFRGPTQDGVSPERGLPVKWGPEENLIWKLKLPGPGSSSPIVLGDRIFLTCFTGYGIPNQPRPEQGDINQLMRHLLCIERTTGKTLWDKEVPARQPESPYSKQNGEHGYTTSTPVTDGERVYVFFGKSGVFAFDLDGKQLWQTDVGKYTNNFGSAASLLLHKNLLLVNATVESGTLFGLDKTSGKDVWKTKIYGDCWSTPVLVQANGKTEMIVNGLNDLNGLDVETGEKLWKCDIPGSAYASSTPLVRNGIIYVMGAGFDGRWFMAVKPGGKDDVTKTHVLWTAKAGASYCSPLLIGDRLYYFSSVVGCLTADKGEILYQDRLAGLGTEYSSPVVADGKIYLFTRRGGAHVLAPAKDRLELLAHNKLDDATDFVASPAVSHGQLYMRSQQYLYCIGQKK